MEQINPYRPPTQKISLSSRKYHVFLSFRGPDVRKNLVDHLFDSLSAAGIHVYLDNERLEKGKDIDCSLRQAIEDSDIYIPIFSPRYAESTWCLDEVAQISESRGLVIPLFYGVQPSDVRYPDKEKSPYAKAFEAHENKKDRREGKLIRRYPTETIAEWKKALKTVADLSGWTLETTSGYERKFVQRVVSDVLRTLNKPPLEVANHVVGLKNPVATVIDSLKVRAMDDRILTLGIWGIGGMGKTTLAKAVFNEIYLDFDASCFVSKVRIYAHENGGLEKLQRYILNNLLVGSISVDDVAHGRALMKDRLASRRSLLILDDVEDFRHIEALGWDCLGPGSRVVVTTRDKRTLIGYANEIYTMEGLEHTRALELFSWHAFKRECPDHDHKDLSTGVVKACGGLPLALEAAGAFLFRNPRVSCREVLRRVPEEIFESLKVGYDALRDQLEKQIFLDIACFFVGEKTGIPILFWKALNWSADAIGTAIDNLKLKSLIKVSDKDTFLMHDQIRNMGREIVAAESPDHPGSRSRLWNPRDVQQVICNKQGTGKMRYAFISYKRIDRQEEDAAGGGRAGKSKEGDRDEEKEKEFQMEYLESMPNLELLSSDSVPMGGEFGKAYCSNLKWLELRNCYSLKRLPSVWDWDRLVVLRVIGGNNIHHLWNESWNRKTILKNLKVLRLVCCEGVTTMIDSLRRLPRLKYLELLGCSGLTTIPDSINSLSDLEHLDLSRSVKLTTVPDSIGSLIRLECLNLSKCSSLTTIPASIDSLVALKRLNLSYCSSLETIPDSFAPLLRLELLELKGCARLTMIPNSVGTLFALKGLNFSGCSSLGGIPSSIRSLLALETLNLSGCSSLRVIPNSVGSPLALTRLHLSGCFSLTTIPGSIGSLPALTDLNFSGCSNLVAIPDSIGDLQGLKSLSFSHCSSLWAIPDSLRGLLSLKVLNVSGCSSLRAIPGSIGSLPALEELNLSRCRSIRAVPDAIGTLPTLKQWNLSRCSNLVAIPDSVGCLPALEGLDLSHCSSFSSDSRFCWVSKGTQELEFVKLPKINGDSWFHWFSTSTEELESVTVQKLEGDS